MYSALESPTHPPPVPELTSYLCPSISECLLMCNHLEGLGGEELFTAGVATIHLVSSVYPPVGTEVRQFEEHFLAVAAP